MEDLLMEPYLFCQPRALDPVPECRDEKQILVDLANKSGMEGYFCPMDTGTGRQTVGGA
jgi:hypothetical protein